MAFMLAFVWPMPAWVWRDVRSVFFLFIYYFLRHQLHEPLAGVHACPDRRWRLIDTSMAHACMHGPKTQKEVLHGESSKRLATPRNTKDREHLQSTQSAQPTNLTDQAQSTTERTARETHNTN